MASSEGKVKLRPVQRCKSLEGWQPVLVPSASSDRQYVVHVNPWGQPSEAICECKSYQYRSTCRHQLEAIAQICGWSDEDGEEQNLEQQKERICPRCHGKTYYTMEIDRG